MNDMDELITLITDKSRIMYRERSCFKNEAEYAEVLKGVFKIYDGSEGVIENTRHLSVKTLAFVELIYPFLLYATNIVSQDCDLLYITEHAMDDLECLLLEKLSKLSSQAFFFEFSNLIDINRRTNGFDSFLEDTEAVADGINKSIIYDEFVNSFFTKGWRDFFLEYSILTVLMSVLTLQWIQMVNKFTAALHKDYDEIGSLLSNEGMKGKIVSIKTADQNGLSPEDITLCITFGNDDKLIYKARNLEVDRSFQTFLNWISNQSKSLPLKSMRMINTDHYGWQEYVPQAACLSEEEVNRFYIRAGMLLGVLYVFGSSDMHCLNLIANGEYPVLIDMEALTGSSCDTDVMSTFFLPYYYVMSGGMPEYSNALGSETFTKSIRKELHWEHVNTDRMKPVYLHREVSPKSVVFHNDKKVFSYQYQEQLLEGFEVIYQYVMNHKKNVLESIAEYFNSSAVRYYPRVYKGYINAAYNSLLPGFLRSGTDRLSVLRKEIERAAIQNHHISEEFIFYELEKLMVNSIPRFHITFMEGTVQELSDVNLAEFHPEAPINIVKGRLNRFTSSDLEQQKLLIRKAFQDYKTNIRTHETEPYYV